MTETTLFGEQVEVRAVPAPPEPDSQWRIESLQVVNWGGFTGARQVDFHPVSNLLSGHSGSGKSTLLDAYTALMMPSDTKFNGASNDATVGRARSEGQRTLLTYLRGVVDSSHDEETGREMLRVLRGDRADTWGAVAATFVDERGKRFTALRIYYVPKNVTRSTDITARMATLEGTLDLADIEPAASGRFNPRVLRQILPDIHVHHTYSSFANTLFARLGIGAGGDGAKALRMLARVQAGAPIRTVDELYKETVLETPATFAAADQAIEHFDYLESGYAEIVVAERKERLLSPLPELQARKEAALARMEALDAYGVNRGGDTPLQLWRLGTRAAILTDRIATVKEERARVGAELLESDERYAALSRDRDRTRGEHRASGGEALERLGAEIEVEQARLADRVERRTDLVERTRHLAEDLTTSDGFEAALEAAEEFGFHYEERRAEAAAHRDRVLRDAWTPQQDRSSLRRERASLEGRTGRVPGYLDRMRREAAEAAGMDVKELPFLAELIDVHPGEQKWRLAIETVLAPTARLMLVPQERFDEFSAALDLLDFERRLTFHAVPAGLDYTTAPAEDRVAGKLVHDESSPFTGWVRRHLADPSRNALCVDDVAGLNGDGLRVTLSGQTRSGHRGAHGRASAEYVIGFSNEDALVEIDAQLAGLEDELRRCDEDLRVADARLAELDYRKSAYDAVRTFRWVDVDVLGAQRRVDELTARRDAILSADDTLRAPESHIQDLTAQVEAANADRVRLKDRREVLESRFAELVTDEDDTNDEIERILAEGEVVLSEDQARGLDEEFAHAVGPGDPNSLEEFTNNLGRLQARLRETFEGAAEQVAFADAELVRIFESYKAQWPDPNLSAAPEALRDFVAILEAVSSTGLASQRAVWKERLTEWSGQDLVPLAGAMSAAVEEIEDRLGPINEILRLLPFGPTGDRLRMRLRTLAPAHVTDFLHQLRTLSADTTLAMEEEALEVRFQQLRVFINQIRRREDPLARPGADRERLLDVRRHVEVYAERLRPDGSHLSNYRTLAQKSGGETQELVAFIIGAALRFRLGDEERQRPRFAPVFLDEAFIKADAQFAGRAVHAWKGLGFQIVVGAPEDKVNALEPHMDKMFAVLKNHETNLSRVVEMQDVARA